MTADTEKKPKRGRWLILIAAVLVVMMCLCLAVGGALFPRSPQTPVGERGQAVASAAVESTTLPVETAAAADAGALPSDVPAATDTAILPTETPAPTDTPAPTNTPAPPTETPLPTNTPALVRFEGTGQQAVGPFTLPSSVSAAHFTHAGQSNFAVIAHQGDQENLLINTIGAYDGVRPLFGEQQVLLDIDADGEWTLEVTAIGQAQGVAFTGNGDAVSGLFEPPGRAVLAFKHDGDSNFAVLLHCTGGSDLIQNEIGPVEGTGVVNFPQGPCLWEVEADGAWSLVPQ